MKKLLFASLLMAGAATVFGQGAITWNNNVTGVIRAPIYGVDPIDSTVAQSGQSSVGTPAGATVYGGALLQGTGWTVGFFAGANAGSMSLLGQSTFRTANGNVVPAGLFLAGGTVAVPGVAAGSTAAFQFRVWQSSYLAADGTTVVPVTTWADAATLWMTKGGYAAGQSSVVTSAALGGINPADGSIVTTPNTTGWTSFQLTAASLAPIPEPSTFALAGLAGAAMLIFRRRK